MLLDKFKEECGVFALSNCSNAVDKTMFGLHSLQHRGQEACGVVARDGDILHQSKSYGLVFQNLATKQETLSLKGNATIGHVRYSTSGEKNPNEVQPFLATIEGIGGFALAHNGNLTNAQELRTSLLKEGHVFSTSIDTEVLVHLISKSKQNTIEDKIRDALSHVKGAYSVVAITKDKLIAFRDKNGIRPLSIGSVDNNCYVFASETCAFDSIGASFVRNVEPGEMVTVDKFGNLFSTFLFKESDIVRKFCVFEYIYFARPDSIVEGNNIYHLRKQFGKILAQRNSVSADVVIPVPDSGVPSALGFSEVSGIPFELGIVRSHYTGRSFIDPNQFMREFKVQIKHNVNKTIVEGKRVVLIDDSIVRGTTSKKIIKMLFDAGAKEVHMKISSPPTQFSCFYGIDTPDKDKLIASIYNNNVNNIAQYLGLTSLEYLSIDDMYSCIKNMPRGSFCDACFTGNYFVK